MINLLQLARAYFPGKLYEFLTSNIAESMSNCLGVTKKLPLQPLVKKMRENIGEFFCKRNVERKLKTTQVTPGVLSILQEKKDKPRQMSSSTLTSYNVDLGARTCSYRDGRSQVFLFHSS